MARLNRNVCDVTIGKFYKREMSATSPRLCILAGHFASFSFVFQFKCHEMHRRLMQLYYVAEK